MRRSVLAVAVAIAVGVAGRGEAAFVTAAVATGPGGTASFVLKDVGATTNVIGNVIFTAVAPIDITLTVEGTGQFSLGFDSSSLPTGSVLNQAGQTIGSIDFGLINPPTGAFLVSVFYTPGFPLSNPSSPGSGFYRFSGPPNLLPGQSASFGGLFQVGNGTGPQTLTVRLTPTAAVPEPSSLALAGIAIAGLGGWARRRRSA